jgi:hypothetical protein
MRDLRRLGLGDKATDVKSLPTDGRTRGEIENMPSVDRHSKFDSTPGFLSKTMRKQRSI